MALYVMCVLAICVLTIVSMWKVLVKAGLPGWSMFIPFYNLFVQTKMVWGNGWLMFLFVIPVVGFIAMIKYYFDFAKSFGKGIGFGFGLLFLPIIFLPLLAFGDAQYIGPKGE